MRGKEFPVPTNIWKVQAASGRVVAGFCLVGMLAFSTACVF